MQACKCGFFSEHGILTTTTPAAAAAAAAAATTTTTWPHLRCDVGLEEGNIKQNCLCATVLCIIIMVNKGTSSSYRLVDCIGF